MSPVLRAATVLAALLAVAPVQASPELAKARNCVACHHPERKMVGPSYKAIATRYADDPNAVQTLSEKVIKGGGGVWSPMPMPAQANVSPSDAEALVQWILSQK